ncbi:MAG TPA: galactokinase [Opitutaceae bacterium]|jgi:galactokinase|nr:galactokinase [Opitutaceae bacterium]
MTDKLIERFREVFSREPEIIARAPGRIEVIGNHTDYNGGTVLGAAINRCVWVGLARRSSSLRRFASDVKPGVIELAADSGERRTGAESWVNYPLGVLGAFQEASLDTPEGFDYMAMSNVPTGAGLSSSAAIELSSALAFLEAKEATLDRKQLVSICQRAENKFVGVPCGILDQGVSGYGKVDHLVYIDCREKRFDTVPMPSGANFWIFNTHTKHALIDGLYAERHGECMDAAKIMGVPLLVEATPALLASSETKLSRTSYKRARHVIDEIARVEKAVAALRAGDMPALGKLLLASHRSSKTWFENSSPELDFLVDSLEPEKGVYGARLTGGGFGGAVMALTNETFGTEGVERISDAYLTKFGSRPEVLHAKTDDGASLVKGVR